jgi:hypothetical protein
MKIIALIDDAAVICGILTHLGLWRERKGIRARHRTASGA